MLDLIVRLDLRPTAWTGYRQPYIGTGADVALALLLALVTSLAACGTRFYALAVIATVVICAVILLMYKFNLFALNVQRQVVKVSPPTATPATPPG